MNIPIGPIITIASHPFMRERLLPVQTVDFAVGFRRRLIQPPRLVGPRGFEVLSPYAWNFCLQDVYRCGVLA